MRRFLVGALFIMLLVTAMAMTACGEQEETATTAAPTTAAPATTAPSEGTETTAGALKEDVLKIGAITSLTGDAAPSFKALYDSAGPSEDVFNEEGGLTIGDTHYTIDISVYDDQSTTSGALTAMNKLLGDGIKFMIPPMFVANNLAIASLAEENKIIRVKSLGVSADEVNAKNPYAFFSCCVVYSLEPFYEYVDTKHPDIKKVAVISPDDPVGEVFQTKLKGVYEERGIEIAYWEVFPMPTFDFYPILNKAIATNPDAIEILYGMPQMTSALINQARELGYKGPILGSVGPGDAAVTNSMLTPEYADNIIFADRTYAEFMSPRMKLVEEKVLAAGASFERDSFLLIDAISAMLAVMETAQSLDPDEFVAAVDSGACASFEGAYGLAHWNYLPEVYGNNHAAAAAATQIVKFVNGELEFELVE